MNIDDYLGRPWLSPGYDCWGLVRDVYQRELNVSLPAFLCDSRNPRKVGLALKQNSSPLNPLFKECDLKNYAIVGFSKLGRLCHVGIYYDGGYLHCDRGVGVCYESSVHPYVVSHVCELVG